MSRLDTLKWLHADAIERARRAGGPRAATLKSIEEVVSNTPAPELEGPLLEALWRGMRELTPLPQLVLSLQLLGWLSGSDLKRGWSIVFGRTAVSALYALGRLELFPLRAYLLGLLLDANLPPKDRADLFFRRGNTFLALSSGTPKLRERASQDLKAAIELARACGEARVEVSAECTLARVELLDDTRSPLPTLEAFSERVTRLEALLPRATSIGHAEDVHDLLADLEGRRSRLGHPEATARVFHHARQAAQLTREPAVKATRLATLSELLLVHGAEADRPEALQAAREAVASLPADAGDIHAPAPLHALGRALMLTGQTAEALGQLEHALTLMARQPPSVNRNLVRLHLAQALLELDRPDDARHHVELVFGEARAIGDRAALVDASQLLAMLMPDKGRAPLVQEQLTRAEAELEGTPDQTLLALQRLVPRTHGEPLSMELLELLRRILAGQVPTDGRSDAQLQMLVGNHAHELPSDIRRQLLQHGQRILKKVHVRARLLHAEGQEEMALGLLRDAFARLEEPEDRLHTAALLVILLPREAREERLHWCAEVESLLEGPRDNPYIRADLASALWMCGRKEPGVLERAWRHAERAATHLQREPSTRTFITWVLTRIRLDQLSLRFDDSSPATWELASWFTRDLSLSGEELADYRCHAIQCLLAPGPLSHPEALAMAERLLGLVPEEDTSRAIQERLQAIRARLASLREGPLTETLGPDALRGPFDAVPAWVVALARGEDSQPDGPLGARERGALLAVVQVRPDRTDAALSCLFSQDDDPWAMELLADEVARSSSGASMRSLLERVEKTAAEKPSFRLLRLRVALHRRNVGPDGLERYREAVDALLAFARTPQERIEARLIKGIERMDAAQVLSHGTERVKAAAALQEARQLLGEALEEARHIQHETKELFALLVSLGNALRRGDAPELERALALYTEAETLQAPTPDESAKLWKVKADALLERGAAGDAERALALLERALTVRKSGFLRVETLLSAARAEKAQPGHGEPARLRRALDRLDEAARLAEGHYALGVAYQQVGVLARLVRHHPEDVLLQRRLDALGRQHPELDRAIRRARQGVPGLLTEDLIQHVVTTHAHPALMAFQRAIAPLISPDLDMAREMAPGLEELIEQQHQSEDRSFQVLRARADGLARVEDPHERPGAALGRAWLLAHLAGEGHARAEAVERVAREAEQLIRGIHDSEEVRLRLLLELAHVWAPRNHHTHAVRDFQHAAELAREVREAATPGGPLARSALQSLARATRYITGGDLAARLREAERLYEQCVQEYEAAGEADIAAHVRGNLAELRAELRTGDHLSDLQAGIDAARAYLAGGGPLEQRARTQLALAINLTMAGAARSWPEGKAQLTQALELFAGLDRSKLSTSDLHSVDNYRTIALADLAHAEGRHEEAISLWRQRLESLGREAPDEVWAYTAHNLADMLLRRGSNIIQVMEGLALAEKALQVRTLDRNPVHHWETCENIGRTAALLLLYPPGDMDWPEPVGRGLWARGESALRGALEAARRLGSHERLVQSAVALLQLALTAPTAATLESTAEEGWKALDEARPYLLLDDNSGRAEARLGAELAISLAVLLAEEGLVVVSEGLEFLLSGERAERVLRWVCRSVGAAQRRLASRTSRPESVPHATWVRWLAAVRDNDVRAIGRALDSLRHEAPSFLRGEPGLDSTWSWLRSHPDSAALALVEGEGRMIATVLTHGEQKRVLIAGLSVDAPPCDEATVARGLSEQGPSEAYRELLAWARQGVVEPLRRLLPERLSHLLWVPGGVLRALAPADLWPTVPVTCAARLDLETRPQPARPRRTLLAVADPGPGAQTAQEIPGAVEAGAELARLAQGMGPLRVRMSRGPTHGRALGVSCPELQEGPASPEDLLRELAEVDVALLLCHGQVKGLREARLLLVDGGGALAPLDLERLAEDPTRIAGTTVVLLSCEAGRVGDWLHQAGGLAGTLLACGARGVIAPLWPVRVTPAVAVGECVLRALAAGEELSVALQRLQAPEEGPSLGRVSREQRAQERAWSIRAFLHWTG